VLEVISYNEAAGALRVPAGQGLPRRRQAARGSTPTARCASPATRTARRSSRVRCGTKPTPIRRSPASCWPAAAASTASLPERGVDVPYAIDNASERANGFALTQRLWRQGCGGDDAGGAALPRRPVRRRLRHALSGGQAGWPMRPFAQAVAVPLRERGSPPLARRAGRRQSRHPNRNPLQGHRAGRPSGAPRRPVACRRAAFDPLLPRSAAEVWLPDAPGALRRATTGLAEFVAAPDRQRLAAALAGAAKVAGSEIRLPCRFEDNAAGSRRALRCGGPGEGVVEGRLELRGGRPLAGVLTRLTLPGGTALTGIEVIASGKPTATRTTLQPRAGGAGELPRSAAGDAIVGLDLTHGAARVSGEIGIRLRHDFAVAQRAIDRLLAGPAAATLFGATPFPRQPLFQALFAELGAPRAGRLLPGSRTPVATGSSRACPAAAPGATGSDPASAASSPTAPPATRPPRPFRRISCRAAAAEVGGQAAPLRAAPLRALGDGRRAAGAARRRRRCRRKACCRLLPATRKAGATARRAALLAQVGEQWLRAESGQARNSSAARRRLRGLAPVPAGALNEAKTDDGRKT
jgi:hypothetical protein